MKNKKEQISSGFLMFSIGCFIQSSTLLLGFLTANTKQDSWIVVITGFVATLPIIWIYLKLASKFPGKNIIEINDIVYGNIIGKIFSTLYILFFVSLASLNSDVISDFIVGSILPETPQIVILVMFISLCAYAVRKGIEPITRCSTLFVLVVGLVLIINGTLLIGNMKLSNFLPIFSLPIKKYIQGTMSEVFLPYEIIVFFMLFPNLQSNTNLKKPLLGGLLIGGVTMLFIAARDIAVLGPSISLVANPAFEAIRLINIANTLTRMEIVYAIILITLSFFKISILYFVSVKAISQIFKIEVYKPLILVIGVLIINFALINFKSSIEHAYWGAGPAAIYSMFFELVLPLITLIIVTIQGLFKKKMS